MVLISNFFVIIFFIDNYYKINEPKEIESKKEQNETNEFSFVIDNSLEEIYIKNADLGKDTKNNSEDNQKD